ncbi:hypothetical protein STENM327S_01509 [Streptomyces tendae]
MVLGPLTTAELREAVTAPARAVGMELEPGLAELIIREVSNDSPRGAHDAGVLPLLSHALLATWQRRKAGRLTLAGYRAAGGIQGAVAATAERAWSGLDPAARTAARLLLLRLVRLSEDTQATRRRSTRRRLAEESGDPEKTEESLEALVRARLVTLDADTVEITHEALLHAWPRLRDWIDEDRAGNLLRQRLEEDGLAWEESDRDSALLYRGSRLAQASGWAKSAGDTFLTRSAVEFLAAAVRLRRRTVMISRAAVSALVVLALVAVGSAVLAWQQRNDAVFEQVVAEADRVEDTDPSCRPSSTWPRTACARTTRTSGTAARPSEAAGQAPHRAHQLGEHRGLQPGRPHPGQRLGRRHDPAVERAGPQPSAPARHPLTGHGGTVYLLAFRPDGRTLASAHDDHAVRLWNVADPRRPEALDTLTGPTAAVRSVAFSPDGHTLAAGGDDEKVRLWDVADPRRPEPVGAPLAGHSGLVHSVAFSPDGRTLASGSADDTVRLWDVTDPAGAKPVGAPLTGHSGPVWAVTFSPDGAMLAASSADSTASLWNVSDPAYPSQVGVPLAGGSGEMYALGFSPDGHTLATGSGDSKVRLWSLPTSDVIGRTGAFRSDGRVLATAARDGRVRRGREVGLPAGGRAPFKPGWRLGSGVLPARRQARGARAGRACRCGVTVPARPKAHGPPGRWRCAPGTRAPTRWRSAPTGAPSPRPTTTGPCVVEPRTRPTPAVGRVGRWPHGYVDLRGSVGSAASSPAAAPRAVRLWDVTAPVSVTRGGARTGRSGPRGSAHDDSLLVLLGRGRLTLVRAGGRGTLGGLVDGHIAVDLLRLASRLGVACDADDGIALAQIDQLNAHGVTAGLPDPVDSRTNHTARECDGEDLVVLLDHQRAHERPAVLDDLGGLDAEATATLDAVLVDGGPLRVTAVGGSEHERTGSNNIHREQLVPFAETHALDARGGTSHRTQRVVRRGEPDRLRLLADQQQIVLGRDEFGPDQFVVASVRLLPQVDGDDTTRARGVVVLQRRLLHQSGLRGQDQVRNRLVVADRTDLGDRLVRLEGQQVRHVLAARVPAGVRQLEAFAR